MAIAFGASHGGAVAGGASSLSLTSLAIVSDSLILCAIRYNSGSVTVSSLNLDDGFGGNAQAFTQIDTYAALDSSNARVSLWYLANPNNANTRIIVTNSGATDTYMCAAHWTGAATSDIFADASRVENDTSEPWSITNTSARDGSWHVGTMSTGNAGLTPGTGSTQRVEQSDNLALYDSNGTVANTVTHTFEASGGSNAGIVAAMMQVPAAAPATTTTEGRDFMIMGAA